MQKYIHSNRPSIHKTIPVNLLFMLILFPIHISGQDLPLGYISYYSEKANSIKFLSTLSTCNPQYWNISRDKNSTIIYPVETDSLFESRFVLNMGVVKNMVFGEFIMEFDFLATSILNSGLTGFCFLSPVKSFDTYYMFVFGSDSVSFVFVNKGIPEIMKSYYLKIRIDSWNHIKITRDILKRSVTFILNKDPNTEVIFTDPRLVMGYAGFGTCSTQSSIRNINIWAPTVITDTTFICK